MHSPTPLKERRGNNERTKKGTRVPSNKLDNPISWERGRQRHALEAKPSHWREEDTSAARTDDDASGNDGTEEEDDDGDRRQRGRTVTTYTTLDKS